MKYVIESTLIVWSILIVACAQPSDNQNVDGGDSENEQVETKSALTLAAAANLRYVLVELERDFEKNHNVDLEIVLASSGKLTNQIINGAPYHAFMSANMKFPNALHEQNLTLGPPEIYATGALILWSAKDFDLEGGLVRLLDEDIDKVAIANDKNAPYGKAAREALEATGVFEKLEDKIVYGESVSQVNQYVSSESVDVGLTNKSVALGKMQGVGVWADVDPKLYAPIDQGIVIIKGVEKEALSACQQFKTYLSSTQAQKIFVEYGYLAP